MELPKREKILKVEVEEGVVAVLDTMTSRDVAEIWDREPPKVLDEDEGKKERRIQFTYGVKEMVEWFEKKLRSFEGEDMPTFDGEPFDRSSDHLARIPHAWKVTGGSKLIEHGMMGAGTRGNSGEPGEH